MRAMASSSDDTFIIGMTGPNVSSRMTRISCETFVRTCGAMKLPWDGRESNVGFLGVESTAPRERASSMCDWMFLTA
jgi:hypothetical protein